MASKALELSIVSPEVRDGAPKIGNSAGSVLEVSLQPGLSRRGFGPLLLNLLELAGQSISMLRELVLSYAVLGPCLSKALLKSGLLSMELLSIVRTSLCSLIPGCVPLSLSRGEG